MNTSEMMEGLRKENATLTEILEMQAKNEALKAKILSTSHPAVSTIVPAPGVVARLVKYPYNKGGVPAFIVTHLRNGNLVPNDNGIVSVVAIRDLIHRMRFADPLWNKLTYPYVAVFLSLRAMCRKMGISWNSVTGTAGAVL